MRYEILKTDILILGSGPGGSVIADCLKNTNKKITIVEQGLDANDDPVVKKNIYDPIFKYYNNGGATPVFSKPIFPFAEAKVMGGGSEINGGLIWKTPKHILDYWLLNNYISKDFYNNADFLYKKIVKDLNVNYDSSNLKGNNDSLIIENASKKNNILSVDVPKAITNCKMHNRCSSICPSAQKNSLSQTLLKQIKNNSQILSGFKVIKLKKKDNSIQYCCVKNLTNNKVIRIIANYYFLCTGAINTPFILRRSNILKKNNSLMFHHNLRFIVDFKRNINAAHGTMFNKQIQEYLEDRFLIMASNYRKSFFASALESKINELDSRIVRFDEHALYTTQVQTYGKGSIKNLFNFNPLITFKFNDKDLELIKLAIMSSVDLFFKSDAKQIILPLKKNFLINSFEEYIDSVHNHICIEDIDLLSVHAMSSVPMGLDANYPVDDFGRLKNTDNLFISDASILPTNIGESPQGTIMIFANYIAKKFIEMYL